MFRRTSSSFTKSVVWERLRDVVLTRLADPALYDVSVRSLAALTRICPGGDKQTRRLRTYSQASSPRSVALPQLPSSSTLSIGAIIWYTDPLETPSFVQGTFTPQQSRPCRAYTSGEPERRIGRVLKSMVLGRRRVTAGVTRMSVPTDNESWIIEAGDAVIQKKASAGVESLSVVERLIYCLWVADYGMRNAGDLDTASDVYADFQTDGARLAGELGLKVTQRAFALPTAQLQRSFLASFEKMCDEIRQYVQQGARETVDN